MIVRKQVPRISKPKIQLILRLCELEIKDIFFKKSKVIEKD